VRIEESGFRKAGKEVKELNLLKESITHII
jgi:hypothetical protein